MRITADTSSARKFVNVIGTPAIYLIYYGTHKLEPWRTGDDGRNHDDRTKMYETYTIPDECNFVFGFDFPRQPVFHGIWRTLCES